MPVIEPLSDEEITHTLNEPLLKEAEDLKVERNLMKERLEKLEQTRRVVSDAVYQKVRADYIAKIDGLTERLAALKKDLDAEQTALLRKKEMVETTLRRHRENIEESHLRHTLGEFSAERHQELLKKENEEVSRLETALERLEAAVERHQNLSPPPSPASEPPSDENVPITAKISARAEKEPETNLMRQTGTGQAADRQTDTPPTGISQATARQAVARPAVARQAGTQQSAPAGKRVAEIALIENGKEVQTVPLDKTVQIGRSPSNDIVLKEPKVSRKHAEVHCAAGKYILLDLDSSNGTFVGGKKITEQVLQPGDEISIGNAKMIFKI